MGIADNPTLITPDYQAKPLTLLKSPVVNAISLVNKGANKKRFYMFKSEDSPVDHQGFYVDADGHMYEDSFSKLMPLIKAGPKDDVWKAVYCVVAVPGEVDAQKDVWDEETIRDAAHSYLKKSRLINYMHEDLDSVGNLVESAIAPTDMKVGEEYIPKGSWFIGIEPHPEMKKMIENGDITGVSVQGSSKREHMDSDHPMMLDMAKGQFDPAVVPRTVTQTDYEIPESKDDMEVPAGTQGPGIVALQHKLGIPETGKFDSLTMKAVQQWMAKKGVPGKPTLATIKLILQEDEGEETPAEAPQANSAMDAAEKPSGEVQEEAGAAGGPEREEALKLLKARGEMYHFRGDSSKTPLWVGELEKDSVIVKFPEGEDGEAETAKVSLDEIYKCDCDDPEQHYEGILKNMVKDHPGSYERSHAGGPYNPVEDDNRFPGTGGSRAGNGFDSSSYGTHPENQGTQPAQLNPDSSDDELKAAILRSLSNGNELLLRHLSNTYNINTSDQIYTYPFTQDELWGLVARYILGRMDNPPSESMADQPARRTDKSYYPEGSGFSMQKVAPGDYHRPSAHVEDKNGEPILAGAVVKVRGKEAHVSSVDTDAQTVTVEFLPRDGDAELKTFKANSAELVVGDPAADPPANIIIDVKSLEKGVWSGSHGGHDPEAKGKIRYIVRSFGKWARGKQSVAARKLLERGVVKTPKAANRLAAWLKDQWMGSTKWRKGRQLGKSDETIAPDAIDFMFKAACGLSEMEVDDVAELLKEYGDEDSLEKALDELFGDTEVEEFEKTVERHPNNEEFKAAMTAFQLGVADAIAHDELEKQESDLHEVIEDFQDWLNEFVATGNYYDYELEKSCGKDHKKMEKGWLPSNLTQNDLDDGDFAWLSSAYKAGEASKTEGRKLPYKVHGKVDPAGWKAAWAAVHGARGGTDLNGGPNKEAVIRRLLQDKPKSIEVANMEKMDNLKGATVQDSEGRKWIVMAHDGDTLSVVSGKNRAEVPASSVKVVKQPMGKMDEGMDGAEGEDMMARRKRQRIPMPPKPPVEKAGPEAGMEEEGMDAPKKRKRLPMPPKPKAPEAPEGDMPERGGAPKPPMPPKAKAPEGDMPEGGAPKPPMPPKPEGGAPEPAGEGEGESAGSRLARLLAAARKRRKEAEGGAPEPGMEKGDMCKECGMEKGMCKCGGMMKSAEPLTAAKIDRLRETRNFLESVLNYEAEEAEETEETYDAEEAYAAEAPEVEAEDTTEETVSEAEAYEPEAEEADFDNENTEVEKDVDMESNEEVTLDMVVEAINGLGDEVDGILSRVEEFDTLGSKLDQIGDLAKSLDSTERVDVLEQAVEKLTEVLGTFADSVESVETIEKRLSMLEEQPGGQTAAPVDAGDQVIEKSAPEEPALFQRSWGSVF